MSEMVRVQSIDPETAKIPSGENAAHVGDDAIGFEGGFIIVPVFAFHKFMTPSFETDIRCSPSGENTADTNGMLVRYFSGPTTIIPALASQTRMVQSRDVDTTCLLSGENATDCTKWE